MGMAASQARLLSITARLSNNEMEQQSIAYSKQRLSDNTERINDAYLDAMAKTKYQVLTGYNGAEACYEDLTYNQIAGPNSVAIGKQYLVKDNKGKVVVPQNVAKAFEDGNGDFNRFLQRFNLTQSDINVKDYKASEEAIHDAWDRYLVSVGQGTDNANGKHILNFGYNTTYNYPTYSTTVVNDTFLKDGYKNDLIPMYQLPNGTALKNYKIEVFEQLDEKGNLSYKLGFVGPDNQWNDLPKELSENITYTYNEDKKKFQFKCNNYYNQTGKQTTEEALDSVYINDPRVTLAPMIFDSEWWYMNGSISETRTPTQPINFEGTTAEQRELYDYACSITTAFMAPETQSFHNIPLQYDSAKVKYYRNIFNEMLSCGYTTVEKEENFKDSQWFVSQLKAGKLVLSYYSDTEKTFKGTSIDSDESITEKEDTAKMKMAEQVYQQQMRKVESQDKQFDLQLNKLEAEHNALQTEYESVKKVISKNVEKSFNTFS